ncbi:MAG: hypothetical protein MUD10_03505 [Candidatus Pacebacteria bacterium]|jgi:hypothetical protein|nr:hypothetical protein [Candidatus Paceibacterota bacterium]
MSQNFDAGEKNKPSIIDTEFEVVGDGSENTDNTNAASSEVMPAVRPQEGGPAAGDLSNLKHGIEVNAGREWRTKQRARIDGFISQGAAWLSRREAFGVSVDSVKQKIDRTVEGTDAVIGRAAIKYDKIKAGYEVKKRGFFGQLAMFSAKKAGAGEEVLSAFAEEMARRRPQESRDRKGAMDHLRGAWQFTAGARQEAGRLLKKSEKADEIRRKAKTMKAIFNIMTRSGS